MLFTKNFYMDYDEVYKNSVLDRIDEFDESNPAPSRQELAFLSFVFRIVIICVAPASIFIYHTRLTTFEAFQDIKKYQFNSSRGIINYQETKWYFRLLYCCSKTRK